MNTSALKVLSLVLITIGIMAAMWFDRTRGIDTPLLWLMHVGVFLALTLLALESVKRTILPFLLWVAAYGYTMITMSSILTRTNNPLDIPGSSYESLFIIPALAVAATVATGLALFVRSKANR